ncbi:MAG: hypothetical protein M9894_04125 [Planctomycetes bacterium]|nr:hypothetical protein [Planctomycetota bacterium]
MADERLRALERAAAASGSLEDEVRLLETRVRLGDLAPGWLELAARLGHEPARRALTRFVPVVWSWTDLRRLVSDLGPVATVEALLAWAEALPGGRSQALVDAARAWAERPDDEAVAAQCEALRRSLALDEDWTLDLHPDRLVALACDVAAGGVADPWGARASAPAEEQARALRAGLARWALRGGHDDPPAWPEPDLEAQARARAAREALAAFEAALATKAARAEATALRRRLRDKTLARDRLELAADLAHPAAWLVARREGAPDLTVPASPRDVAERLQALVDVRAAPTRTRVRQRRHWVDEGGERSAVGWRTQTGPARWPEWGRRLVVRAALATAEAAAGDEPDAQLRAPLDAVRAWYACPCPAHAEQAEVAAVQAHRVAARGSRAAGVASAAAALAARAEQAWDPGLLRGRRVLFEEAAEAGLAPEALWAHLRPVLIAWALGEDVLAARPYDPRARYAPGEVIEHPTFGRGRVERVDASRVHVVFDDGVRALAQGR